MKEVRRKIEQAFVYIEFIDCLFSRASQDGLLSGQSYWQAPRLLSKTDKVNRCHTWSKFHASDLRSR